MRKIIVLLFCLYTTIGFTAPLPVLHEFHLSRCMIEYNEIEQSLQITLHLFIDDLELALAEQGAKELFIATEKEAETSDTYIERYINQRLLLQVNQNAVNYTYLGKEISEDLAAIWCYLEVKGVNSLEELTISNDLLMEVFDDQKNIINVTGPKEKEVYFLFIKGDAQDHIQF